MLWAMQLMYWAAVHKVVGSTPAFGIYPVRFAQA